MLDCVSIPDPMSLEARALLRENLLLIAWIRRAQSDLRKTLETSAELLVESRRILASPDRKPV